MKKKSYAIVGTIALIVSSLLVCGAVFTYLWNGTVTAQVDYLMQYDSGSGWTNAEDLTVDITTTDLVGGETHVFKHDWRVNTKLNAGMTVNIDFTFTENSIPVDDTGMEIFVYFNDGTTNTTLYNWLDGTVVTSNDITGLSAGDVGIVFIKIIADDNIKADTYSWNYNAVVDVIDAP